MVWKNPPIVNNDIHLFIFIGFSISWMKWSVRDNSSAARRKHYLSNVGEDSIHISCQIIAEEKKGFWNETPIKSPRAWIAAPPFHIFYFIPKLKWLQIMTWEISFWNGEKWIKFLMAYIFELKWVFYIASGHKIVHFCFKWFFGTRFHKISSNDDCLRYCAPESPTKQIMMIIEFIILQISICLKSFLFAYLPTPLVGGQEKSFAEQMNFLGLRPGGLGI